MSLITGTAYQRSPRSASQSKSGCSMGTSSTASAGSSWSVGQAPDSRTIRGRTSNWLTGWPPVQPRARARRVTSTVAGSPVMAPPAASYPAYLTSCRLRIRGPGRSGPSGANTVIIGRIRPPFVAARKCTIDSAATCDAAVTSRRSRTRRLRQYSRPMHRELFRHATRAPNSSSAGVCQ